MKNKIIILIVLFIFTAFPVVARENKNIAKMESEFSLENLEEKITFYNNENIYVFDKKIPKGSIIEAQVVQSERPKSWHRSGFLICKVLSYTIGDKIRNVEDKNVYFIIRKYEPINKKEVAITVVEVVVATGAGVIIPGVDIAYYFTKGAILRKTNPNWFKAGVMNAYDNSICWFWLKGKPIDLSKNDEIKLKYIEPLEARDLSAKIKYKKDKISFKKERKIIKTEVKEINKECKREIKNQNILLAKEEKQAKIILKEQQKMVRIMQKTAKRRAQIAQKNRNK